MNLAIIPARGGSKRIPHKNIKNFAGKPIIAYSIEAAQECGRFDEIIVSTDSEKIAAVAKQYGASVPFRRPTDLADDFTPTAPVIRHAIEYYREKAESFTYICCIYATAPFVLPEYIRQGFELISEKKASAVFSVTTFPFPIFRALQRDDQGHLKMFWPEYELTRSNDLPEAYHDAGQFYWLNCDTFMREKKLYGNDALPVIMPRYLVQDIDTLEDWETAEHMYRAILARKNNPKGGKE